MFFLIVPPDKTKVPVCIWTPPPDVLAVLFSIVRLLLLAVVVPPPTKIPPPARGLAVLPFISTIELPLIFKVLRVYIPPASKEVLLFIWPPDIVKDPEDK